MNSTPDRLIAALRTVLREPGRKALHEPEFGGNEWTYVKECIDTGWVSSVGSYVDGFEARLAEYTGAQHAVAVVNGTAALQVALKLAGTAPGDEVLVPAVTFVATANAIAHCSAIPHFVDSCDATLGVDPAALESYLGHIAEPVAGGSRNRLTGRRLAALVPVHVLGHPAPMPDLLRVASRYGLAVVEDAAESLGSRLGGQHTGTFGALGTLSFNGNKIVTTGGGGAILTNDAALARHAKHLTTTAKRAHAWEFYHDETGFNYRLPNLNAALGCAQLERLPDMLARKRHLAQRYRKAVSELPGVAFIDEPPGTESNFWLNAVSCDFDTLAERDACLAALIEAGYQCRPLWTLMHKLPMYADCPRAPLPVAERLERSVIKLPSSAVLGRPEAA